MEEEEEGKGKHKSIEPKVTDTEVQSAEQAVATATEDAAGGSTGRSYECIFCKRGFSTAQALGGHMNIHRKDRDRSRVATKSSSITTASASASASASEVNYHGYYHPYSTHHKRSNSTSSSFTSPLGAYVNRPPPDHQSSSRYVTRNDGVTSVDEDDPCSTNTNTTGRRRPRELRLFGEELNLGLGLNEADDDDDDDRRRIRDGEEKREDAEELDLELRLGHEPNK